MAVLWLPHGGGPLPLLGDPGHAEMVNRFRTLAARLARPRRLIVVSAHWESSPVAILRAPAPGLLYDYYGFPPRAYQLDYPIPGVPELADAIGEALGKAGIASRQEAERGFDHGVFVPMMLLWPDDPPPTVQVSLPAGLDPSQCVSLGSALGPLLDGEVWLIGSGLSFHNLNAFFAADRQAIDRAARFDHWLAEQLGEGMAPEARLKRLIQWDTAPEARFCHPREEHLLPLHVCLGAAGGRAADELIRFAIAGLPVSGARWRC